MAVDYHLLLKQAESILDGESDLIANLANLSALLYETLDRINWVGFYLMKNNELVLGPFQGKVACTRIPLGKGVCGTCAEKRQTQLVPDVHAFEGHIACDCMSESEIVVPIILNEEVVGVLDIDSPIKNRFSNEDKIYLEKFVEIIKTSCYM